MTSVYYLVIIVYSIGSLGSALLYPVVVLYIKNESVCSTHLQLLAAVVQLNQGWAIVCPTAFKWVQVREHAEIWLGPAYVYCWVSCNGTTPVWREHLHCVYRIELCTSMFDGSVCCRNHWYLNGTAACCGVYCSFFRVFIYNRNLEEFCVDYDQ